MIKKRNFQGAVFLVKKWVRDLWEKTVQVKVLPFGFVIFSFLTLGIIIGVFFPNIAWIILSLYIILLFGIIAWIFTGKRKGESE